MQFFLIGGGLLFWAILYVHDLRGWEPTETEDQGYLRLYGCRPKSVSVGLGCGQGWTPTRSALRLPLIRHIYIIIIIMLSIRRAHRITRWTYVHSKSNILLSRMRICGIAGSGCRKPHPLPLPMTMTSQCIKMCELKTFDRIWQSGFKIGRRYRERNVKSECFVILATRISHSAKIANLHARKQHKHVTADK